MRRRHAIHIKIANLTDLPDQLTGCQQWLGTVDRTGRAVVSLCGRHKNVATIVWELENGEEIPKGMYIIHKCDNPGCVNPDHLKLGTPSENVFDWVRAKRRHPKKIE